jgi:hypothetical protein
VQLFHYTEAGLWPDLLSSGAIQPKWQLNGSPLTVHLSNDPTPSTLPWALRERTVRIAVDIPDADVRPSTAWLEPYLRPEDRWSLVAPSSENQWNGDPDRWFIVERAIPTTEWLGVENLSAGLTLWSSPSQ